MWLYIFIARFAMGERFRKATPGEKGYFAGCLFFSGIAFTLFAALQHFHSPLVQFFDSFGTVGLWLFFVVTISVGYFCTLAWSKYVPLKISVALAIAAWAILLFLLFGLGYLD